MNFILPRSEYSQPQTSWRQDLLRNFKFSIISNLIVIFQKKKKNEKWCIMHTICDLSGKFLAKGDTSCQIEVPNTATLFMATDASHSGWGATCSHCCQAGCCNNACMDHVHFLELHTIFLAQCLLLVFVVYLSGMVLCPREWQNWRRVPCSATRPLSNGVLCWGLPGNFFYCEVNW